MIVLRDAGAVAWREQAWIEVRADDAPAWAGTVHAALLVGEPEPRSTVGRALDACVRHAVPVVWWGARSAAQARWAAERGASGSLHADEPPEAVAAAMQAAARGVRVCSRALVFEAAEARPRRAPDAPVAERALGRANEAPRARVKGARSPRQADVRRLSPRETQVVDALARGLSYAEVATLLGISANTVRTHVRAAYEKLDASGRAEAMVAALRLGSITL